MTISNINADECVGCGTCVATCPADVIKIDESTGTAQIIYPEDCRAAISVDFFAQ